MGVRNQKIFYAREMLNHCGGSTKNAVAAISKTAVNKGYFIFYRHQKGVGVAKKKLLNSGHITIKHLFNPSNQDTSSIAPKMGRQESDKLPASKIYQTMASIPGFPRQRQVPVLHLKHRPAPDLPREAEKMPEP
jgi:hypothetical protein